MKNLLPIIIIFCLIAAYFTWMYDEASNFENQESRIKNQENLEELKINPVRNNISNGVKEVEPTTYAFKTLDGSVIEIGVEKHSPPQPYLKLNKWDGEVSLKVNIPFVVEEEPVLDGNKIRYSTNSEQGTANSEQRIDIEFYPRQPEEIIEKDEKGNEHTFTINEQGGVEFDTILYEKPETNKIVFPIETQGLKFYYQPELTQEEKDNGAFRPENVVGSYAVYHESKSGDYTALGGKNYKAGKAFHIYRPKIHDADGNETWGQLAINNQQLTITINQDWLDNAIYPVTIDPTFGYTQRGATWTGVNNRIFAGVYTSPESGTVDSITVFIKWGSPTLSKAGIYRMSDDSFLGETEELSATSDDTETTYNYVAGPSLSNEDYALSWWVSSDSQSLWLDTSGGNHRSEPETYGDPWPDPITWTYSGDDKYSIYATYSASLGGSCTEDSDCDSGLKCQFNVCCESSCTGDCHCYVGQASTADGYVYGSALFDYATARATSIAYGSTGTYFSVGQNYYLSTYYVYRSFLKFDTSSIPDTDTVTQVKLKLTCTSDNSATDFDVQIIKQDWSAQDPLSDANREAAYDNSLAGTQDDNIWRNTSGIVLNTQYASGNLSTSWINKAGSTYYSLRSNRDYGANTPTGAEYIQIASAEDATATYRPKLYIEYTPPAEECTAEMCSDNYRMLSSSINVGGHQQTSASYQMRDTIGDIATDTSTSTSYKIKAGYQATWSYSPVLIFSITDNTSALGTITTSAASTDTTGFTVAANAVDGYAVTISGNTLTSNSSSADIDALSTPSSSSPGTEQFGINLVDNSDPNVGTDPSGGSGQAATGYDTVNNFKFVSGNTIANSSSFSDTTTFTISYLGNISSSTVAGDYSSTLTVIATGTF